MPARLLLLGIGKAIAVAAILLWSLVPIVFIMISSFKPERDIFATPPTFTFLPTWQHYVDLWAKWGTFFDGLFNSLIITVLATILAIIASAMAGFAYSRRRSRAMAGSAVSLIAVRLIPPVVL